MFGLSDRTMKKIILTTFCTELLGLEVSSSQPMLRLKRAYARTIARFTEERHGRWFECTRLAYEYLSGEKEVDCSAFMLLALGVSERYGEPVLNVNRRAITRAERQSFEDLLSLSHHHDMLNFIRRVSDMIEFLYDLEYLTDQ